MELIKVIGVIIVAAQLFWASGCMAASKTGSPSSFSEKSAATYLNPVLAGDYADPTILKVGADFYMTHSSYHFAPGLLIWRSRDLVHWTPLTHALKQFDGTVWAPEIVHHKARFYIYYPSSGFIHVVTAPSMEGPWSAPVDLKVKGIDPGHVVGLDGKRYLHFPPGQVIELTDDGLSVKGAPLKVYEGWPIPADWRVSCFCLESPKLLFHEGWYHLFSAQGGTGGTPTGHMAVQARSRSPLGPWENSPYNPLVHTGNSSEKWWSRGHGTVFEGASGEWWIVYHAFDHENLPLGRQTLLEPVEWTKDGWARVPAGIDPAKPIPFPSMPVNPLLPLERSDTFAGPELGLQWQFSGEYDTNRFSIKNGGLVLTGKGKSATDTNPLTCVAGHDSYTVDVEVELEGDAQAGLLIYYNSRAYAGLALTPDGLISGNRSQLNNTDFNLPGHKLVLRIVNECNELDFLAGETVSSLRKARGSTYFGGFSSHTQGDFLSLRPALYCAGNGRAIFRNFSYKTLDNNSR